MFRHVYDSIAKRNPVLGFATTCLHRLQQHPRVISVQRLSCPAIFPGKRLLVRENRRIIWKRQSHFARDQKEEKKTKRNEKETRNETNCRLTLENSFRITPLSDFVGIFGYVSSYPTYKEAALLERYQG